MNKGHYTDIVYFENPQTQKFYDIIRESILIYGETALDAAMYKVLGHEKYFEICRACKKEVEDRKRAGCHE